MLLTLLCKESKEALDSGVGKWKELVSRVQTQTHT